MSMHSPKDRHSKSRGQRPQQRQGQRPQQRQGQRSQQRQGQRSQQRQDQRPQQRQGRRPPRRQAEDVLKICGVNACEKLWTMRRDDIIRVYLNQARMPEFSELLSWCAEKRLAYHIVTNEELERITKSHHHEGICIVTRPPRILGMQEICSRISNQTGPLCILLLEGVTNPHNVGAILRVGAHFGASAVICCDKGEEMPTVSTAMCRTAEGGAEYVPMARSRNAVRAVEQLQRCALQTVATSSHATTSFHSRSMPARCLLLFGSEADGLSDEVMALAKHTVAIPGTGWVESINVACAASTLLAEYRRHHPISC